MEEAGERTMVLREKSERIGLQTTTIKIVIGYRAVDYDITLHRT